MGIRAVQAYFISPPVVTDGLIFYFDVVNTLSYRSGSQTIRDMAVPGNYGTLGSGVSYSSDFGGILYFDGTSNAYIDVFNSAASSIDLGSVYTLDLWIKPQTLVSDFNWISAPPATFPDTSPPYHINFGNGTVIVSTVGVVTVDFSISPPIQPQNWINVIFSRADTVVTSYVNTNYVGGADVGGWGSTPFSFGRIGNNPPLYTGTDTGYLSSLKIYNRVLSQAEILQNYNAHKARFGLL